jgi:ABC-2 type transport system permease protein
MGKPLIHLFSFFSKEVNEVLRQPRLVLSLILGPFLVMLLFGLGYVGGLPQFRVALVAPPNSVPPAQLEQIQKAISANFILVSTEEDERAALDKLESGQVDVVEILPTDIEKNISEGRQSTVEFQYAEINPVDESWMEYLGASQVGEMNRTLLVQAVGELQSKTNTLTNLPPENVVSPLRPEYKNLRGQTLSFVNFYAPSVLALIMQHIAVTLGALSLVREQQRGSLEMFRVAPVSPANIILGKYLGYTMFLGILAAILVALLVYLGTPFIGSLALFGLLMLLLINASLGIGFVISCVSNTDSTAVQLSMLALLASIFFSGFFLPLDNFTASMFPLINSIPLTHAIQGFQDIWLKGIAPRPEVWIYLGAITVVAYIIVQWLFRRQLSRL